MTNLNTTQARWILIDNLSGYVWGDSADLNGKIFEGSAIEFAAALDASVGEHDRSYSQAYGLDGHGGYIVYRADIKGSEAVPVVFDGQDQGTIEAVERDCERVGHIRFERADEVC